MSVKAVKKPFTNNGEAVTSTPDRPWYAEYASLSAAAYSPQQYSGYTKKMGYTIDKDLSSVSRTVFYHKNSGRAVIAFKGTSPEKWKHITGNDLAADAGILANISPSINGRFRGADKVYRQTAKKYGAKNVEVTGHSLGGSQAVYIGKKYGAKGIAYEPGLGPADAISRATGVGKKATTSAFRKAFHMHMPDTKQAPVKIVASAYDKDRSLFDKSLYAIAAGYHIPGNESRTFVKPKYKNNHDIKNFL